MKKVLKLFVIILLLCIIFNLPNNISSGQFASSIGTQNNTGTGSTSITTTNIINTSHNYYLGVGYSPSTMVHDPGYLTMISNLMAEVQLFATHGAYNIILFKGTAAAIKIGTSSETAPGYTQIGIDDTAYLYWAPNTKLVTYIACNTGGYNGIANSNSITHYSVGYGGVDYCVGFKKIISYSAVQEWSKNYNMYLASGYGVLDANNYANSFNYTDNNVHSTYLVYNGAVTIPNMLIGNYANNKFHGEELNSISKSFMETKENERNIIKGKVLDINTDNIIEFVIKYLENNEEGFKRDFFEVQENELSISDIQTDDIKNIKYISLNLKMGDFYTDKGYVIKVDNNQIVAIYKNQLDYEKIAKCLKDDIFEAQNDYTDIAQNVLKEYDRDKNEGEEILLDVETPYIYYYDMDELQKYIIVYLNSRYWVNDEYVLAKDGIKIKIEE